MTPVIRAVTALWAALLLGASLLWPVGYGLHELQHIDMTYAYSHALLRFSAPGDRAPSMAASALVAQQCAPPHDLPFGDRQIAARSLRPSLEQLGGDVTAKGAPLPNQMTQHPPLCNGMTGAVLRLPGRSGLA